ncbi:isochorismatase family cysteine hydrolase [Chloroflexota bacterium]
MKSLQNIYINPGNSILMIVDMENEFCKPGGKWYSETSSRIMPGVISGTSGLAERCRSAGIPIIYIQSVRTLREPEFTVFGREPHLEVGTWAVEITGELKPHEGDIVIQKFCSDPFYETSLNQVLQRLVPDPTRYYAIVTGGTVNACVYHAVMGFFLRHYWTVVPVDCVFYLDDSAKQMALELFSVQAYPNVLLSRSDLIEVCQSPSEIRPAPVPGL